MPKLAVHDSPIASPAPARPPTGCFEVFYDGDCPLCVREINMLRRKDRRGRIVFTDIAAAQFSAEGYGKTHEELMAQIHGRTDRGDWVLGVEVFRRLYAAIGFGWLVAPTRLPLLRHGLDAAYRVFAANRLRMTRRCAGDSCRR